MQKLFTKTFFRFLFGFVSILAVAFLFMLVVGFYGEKIENERVTCPQGENCDRG